MSHVSISRSYSVLVGLEAYIRSRKRGQKLIQKLRHGRDKLLSPEQVAKREEQEREKTESAARDQRILEMKGPTEDKEQNANIKLLNKLHIKSREPREGETRLEGPPGEKKHTRRAVDLEAPGTGPENAIAPDGSRSEAPGCRPKN